jgi:hypothetical protein
MATDRSGRVVVRIVTDVALAGFGAAGQEKFQLWWFAGAAPVHGVQIAGGAIRTR